MTDLEWQEFLDDLGLQGQARMHVNRVKDAYLCYRLRGMADKEWGIISKPRLSSLLAKPVEVGTGKFHTLSLKDRERVISVIDDTLQEHVWNGAKLEN